MVKDFGFIAPKGPIPAPDMSFVRLFKDNDAGWQHRGQFAIWSGASAQAEPAHRLLERIGNRVAVITHDNGNPVFHRIANGTPFMIENGTPFWLTVDADAMWVDTPGPAGRYAFLAIGGLVGKPSHGVVDWTCPSCGSQVNPHSFDIPPLGFNTFLKKAQGVVSEFNANAQLRTCSHCNAVHPVMEPSTVNEPQTFQAEKI